MHWCKGTVVYPRSGHDLFFVGGWSFFLPPEGLTFFHLGGRRGGVECTFFSDMFLVYFSVYSGKCSLLHGISSNSYIYKSNHTAFLAYKHAPYIQLYCVYNLMSIQRKLNLWNVHIYVNACTWTERGVHFFPDMFSYPDKRVTDSCIQLGMLQQAMF